MGVRQNRAISRAPRFPPPSARDHVACPGRKPSIPRSRPFPRSPATRPTETWRRPFAGAFQLRAQCLVSHRVKQFPDIAPADIVGMPVQDWSKRPPQTALDFLCGPQSARNPASHVELNQLFDREPRSRGDPALRLPRRGGRDQRVPHRSTSFARSRAFSRANIGDAPERNPSHLTCATNPIGQIPSLGADWRHSHRQPDTALIGHPIWCLRRPQSLDRAMRERHRAARQSRTTSHFPPSNVLSVATLSQQNRRHPANRPERCGIVSLCSVNTKQTPTDDSELP